MSIETDWKKAMKLNPHGDVFIDIVQALRDFIHLEGLTEHEIAAKCGVSMGTINNWLNFRVFSPQLRTVSAVCRGMNLNLRIDRLETKKLKRAA